MASQQVAFAYSILQLQHIKSALIIMRLEPWEWCIFQLARMDFIKSKFAGRGLCMYVSGTTRNKINYTIS